MAQSLEQVICSDISRWQKVRAYIGAAIDFKGQTTARTAGISLSETGEELTNTDFRDLRLVDTSPEALQVGYETTTND